MVGVRIVGGPNGPPKPSWARGKQTMFKFWYDAAMLSIEAQGVIGLRMMTFAAGGTNAHTEARLMVREKISASMEAATTLFCGGSGHAVMVQVRRQVRSNSRRLWRG